MPRINTVMNKQSTIEFQLTDLARLLKQPLDANIIALLHYTLEILNNLGLTNDEALDKAQALNK